MVAVREHYQGIVNILEANGAFRADEDKPNMPLTHLRNKGSFSNSFVLSEGSATVRVEYQLPYSVGEIAIKGHIGTSITWISLSGVQDIESTPFYSELIEHVSAVRDLNKSVSESEV